MQHQISKVIGFILLDLYVIRVNFNDGSAQEITFESVLGGELFDPLCDDSIFRQVRLDTEVHTLVWPNGVDFDLEALRNWPK